MREVKIGDRVETIYNINGILIEVRRGYKGAVAFVETDDKRVFYCPISDLKNCIYIGEIKGPIKIL